MIAVKNHIRCIPIPIPTSATATEIVSVDISFNVYGLIRLVCCYLPQNSSLDETRNIYHSLNFLLRVGHPSLIIGDFNCPNITWSKDLFPSNEKCQLMKMFFLKNQPLTQIIDFPTRESNILDLAFTTNENLFRTCPSLPELGKSDHAVIKIERVCQTDVPKQFPIRNY